MKNKKWLVVVGDILVGSVTYHGPFDDKEHANQWIAANVGQQQSHIVPLENN